MQLAIVAKSAPRSCENNPRTAAVCALSIPTGTLLAPDMHLPDLIGFIR